MRNPTRDYLGDGVYIQQSLMRDCFILTTENGIEVTNEIILEPEIAEELCRYIRRATEGPQS